MDKTQWGARLRGSQPIGEILAESAQQAGAVAGATVTLPDLHVGKGIRYGNLTWFPVWTDAPVIERNYRTASKTQLKVSELQNAQVPLLEVENSEDLPLVLFEGTILEGGRQDRALIRSLVVEANAKREIPVACVEQRRWHGTPNQNLGSRVAPAKVRNSLRGLKVNQGGQVFHAPVNQSEVWDQIEGYENRYLAHGGNSSLANLDEQVKARAGKNLETPVPLAGQRGFIVGVLGKPLALELFDHPDTLAERFESLLWSYQLDAADQVYQATPFLNARDFAILAQRLPLSVAAQQSAETQLQATDGKYCAAQALAYRDELIHVAAVNPKHSLALVA